MKRIDSACYSYWYITFAHELAVRKAEWLSLILVSFLLKPFLQQHNLVSGHNKEHGSYTENISALYLPEFSKLLARIG